MGKIIGIDLGTTNSVVASMEGGKPVVIANSEGDRTTPSVVGFKKNGDRVIGKLAKRQAVTNPDGTIYSIKRLMGKQYDHITEEIRRFPYRVEKAPNGSVVVNVLGKRYTPQEISAMVLQKLKKAAEDFIGESVSDAVITVPAYFNDIERQATKEAGAIAGLNVVRIVNEPTAAALAYGLDKKNGRQVVAVFDLGGGTLDVSILCLEGGVFEVKSTNGDVHLGGDNFDEKIVDWLISEFKVESGVDLRNDIKALQRLKDAAEIAKIDLSNSTVAHISLPFITNDPKALVTSIEKDLSRAKFEMLCQDLLERCLVICEKVVKDSGLSVKDINEVVLVGGSTRIPKVQEMVRNYFGKEPNKSVNPDEVVAVGAAIQGGVLAGDVKDVLLLDVTPLPFGIETMGGVFTPIVDANTTIPTRKSQIFSTAADNQTSVSIHVLQGGRPMAKDNRSLGIFVLDGIPPAPRGIPQIEVTFDIDANSILDVSAKEKTTGKEQKIRIENSSKLSKEEIERMRREAEENAEKDKKEREVVDKINEAESVIFQTEKQLKEYGDKIPADVKTKIEADLSGLKKAKDDALVSKDTANIDAARNSLMQSLQAIYQAMQNAQAQNSNTTTQTCDNCDTSHGNNSANDNAKETSYEEVK